MAWRSKEFGLHQRTSARGACLRELRCSLDTIQFGVESMRMEGPYRDVSMTRNKAPFWPKVFRAHGYFTAQIGKWHTGTDTGYGRDWDFQLVWNRPKYTETSTHYYYDQPITYQGGKTEILKRYSTDQYTDWAVDLIKGKDRDPKKPWYLWLCYGAVHEPYTPADRHMEVCGNRPSPRRPIFSRRGWASPTGRKKSTIGTWTRRNTDVEQRP